MPAFGKCCSLRSIKYQNSRAGSLSPSSMSGPAAAKSVVGWRFAPACFAAQSVDRAQHRSAVLRSTPAPFHKATGALQGLCLLCPTHRAPRSSSWKTSVPFHLVGKHAWQHMSAQENQRGHLDAAPGTPRKWLALCWRCQSNGSWKPNSLLSPPPVMANPSINRTHCGRPPFELKKRSPNATLSQWTD